MNDEFKQIYENSKYSVVGFCQILGISRTRFYDILSRKSILQVKTFYNYKVKIEKYEKSLQKRRKIIKL